MNKPPFVCVLILNWNGLHITIESVASALRSTYPNFAVIVIDNGSTDGSIVALRDEFGDDIEILANRSNLGYSRGFNVGLECAFERHGADYCLVMNNDTYLDENAITELVKVGEMADNIGFVTGKVYYYDTPNVLQTVGKYEDPVKWNGDHIGNGEVDEGQYDEVKERCFVDDIFTLVK